MTLAHGGDKYMDESTDSILTSVKKMLGLPAEYTPFDPDLIMHINTVFFILNQIGIGPKETFSISDASTTWDEFTVANRTKIESIKTYMAARVKLIFDPPQQTTLKEASEKVVDELEWRLRMEAEFRNGE